MKRSRVPGMTVARDHQRGGTILNNPAWTEERLASAAAGRIRAVCHDGTPSMDFACECGATNHMHLSQLDGAPNDAELGLRCYACRQPTIAFTVGTVRRAMLDSGLDPRSEDSHSESS